MCVVLCFYMIYGIRIVFNVFLHEMWNTYCFIVAFTVYFEYVPSVCLFCRVYLLELGPKWPNKDVQTSVYACIYSQRIRVKEISFSNIAICQRYSYVKSIANGSPANMTHIHLLQHKSIIIDVLCITGSLEIRDLIYVLSGDVVWILNGYLLNPL